MLIRKQVQLSYDQGRGLDRCRCPFCGEETTVTWPEHVKGYGTITQTCRHEAYHMVVDGGNCPTIVFTCHKHELEALEARA